MGALELILQNIATSASGLTPILYTLGGAAFLDVLAGSWAAWVSGTFESKFFLEFIKGHIVTKITPIFLLLVAGVTVGGTDSDAGRALVAIGGSTALAYLGVVAASIRNNVVDGLNREKGLPSTIPVQVVETIYNTAPLTDPTSADSDNV